MNKVFFLFTFFILILISTCNVFAIDFDFEQIDDNKQIFYNQIENTWNTASNDNENELILTKKLYDGAGSYSQYLNSDEDIVFTLRTNFEFIKDGELFAINNEELKYYKIIFNGENFIEVPLDHEEVQILFPEVEIVRLSLIDDDNKIWIHKPFLQEKNILFINDSNKYYHKLTPKCTKAQHPEIKALVTISRYGIYRFKHYGQRDGKLTIYVR